MLYKKIIATVAILAISACGGIKLSAITLIPNSKMSAMGIQSFEEMKTTLPINTNVKTNRYVSCVANAITDQVPKADFDGQWEVVVFESDDINAFALPGGKIGVYTGILKVAENQGQLAAIIGHEVAHVIEKHANQRMSLGLVASAALALGEGGLKGASEENRGLIMAGLGMGVNFGVTLPFSRSHETQSDVKGHILMAKAGFNPNDAVSLWQNMAAASNGQPPEFMSSHPSHKTRIDGLTQHTSLVMHHYQAVTNKPKCNAFLY
ncbi:MAG: M48 family metallopeptidase [Saccharospirillaceae bacterium]|nr:M48 family metallopeptidase [Pseudomonadales bacterium]NRB78767.1 M48 family metallopeptidase [Saccharospirillaceae bacterium]